MNNDDNSVRGAQSYEIAFRVGAVGCIILCLFLLVADLLPVLFALAAWTIVTMFVLPWLYVIYHKKNIGFHLHRIRPPNQ